MRNLAIWLMAAAVVNAGSAMAAELAPVFKAPPSTVALPAWSGFYFGGHLGGGTSEKHFVDNFPVFDGELDAAPTLKGPVGGFQAGYNYQFNWLVLGAEGDFSWANIEKRDFSCFAFGNQICSATNQWFATLTGRLGVAFGPALIYMKGGAAWARDKYTDLATCAGPQPIVRAGISAACGDPFTGQHTRHGWTLGGGLEYLIARNWSLKLEYNHMDFGKKSVTLSDPDDNFFTEEIHQRTDVFKFGFNYHFNPTPPAAITARAQAIRATPKDADDDEPLSTVTVFATVDVARQAVSSWGGALFALNKDLDTTGPRLMLLGGGGWYKYYSGGAPFRGIYTFGDVLAGYGFEGDNYSINLLAGINAANHMISPYDPGNTVQGTEAGVKVRASVHTNPTKATLVYGEAEYSTAFQTFLTSGKLGYDFLGKQVFFGPEASYLSDQRSDHWRVGLHASQIKIGTVQVDLSGGYSRDSVIGSGAYGRLEMSRNF